MIGLNKQEQKVLIFLAAVALAGAGSKFVFNRSVYTKRLFMLSENFGKINLNKASSYELISLKGIGPKLAQRIIDYREKQQGFVNVEELKNIKGISPVLYQKIKDSFFVP